MKLATNIICIDLETTDSDNQFGDVVQIGAVMVDPEFKVLDTFKTYVKPLSSHRNPKAMAVNKIDENVLASADTLQEALDLFENFCGDTKMLAAWGNYFDIPFLRSQYTKIHRDWPFGYKSIDLKSIAIWEFGKREIPFHAGVFKACEFMGVDFEGTAHDGLDDIKNTVKVLQRFLTQEWSPFKKGW